ncbi:MAG: MinD/ParA family protein [Nitrospiraceae bacterium]|nr:MAG: MinD/ParA family protein [Nitrospiraceae bacterium]
MDEIKNKFWAVGGGKGGVGKSIVALMTGVSLARLGNKVILLDADLGGSNLHTLVGIQYPQYTLADFISKKVGSLEEVIMSTPVDNLKIICGADDILGMANPKYAQKNRLLNNMKKLNADFIILDLGAGTSFTTVDFFLYAPNKIVVLTPQITSIQNAYGFIKASLFRHLNDVFGKDEQAIELIKRACAPAEGETIDSIGKLFDAFLTLGGEHQDKLLNCINELKIKMIINMVRNVRERNVGRIVQSVAKNYLGLEIEDMGIVQFDNVLNASINNMAGFLSSNLRKSESYAYTNFYDIACNIMKGCNWQSAAPVKTEL